MTAYLASSAGSGARTGTGRHAPPTLRGAVGWLVEGCLLLAAWLVSLVVGARHTSAAIRRRARRAGARGWRAWPLGVRVAVVAAVGVGLLLLFAAYGAWLVGGGLARLLGYLLAGRP